MAAGSADALPLRTGSVDAALAMHMLYHLPRPEAGLAELRRVLRPGGRLVVSTNDDPVDGDLLEWVDDREIAVSPSG